MTMYILCKQPKMTSTYTLFSYLHPETFVRKRSGLSHRTPEFESCVKQLSVAVNVTSDMTHHVKNII